MDDEEDVGVPEEEVVLPDFSELKTKRSKKVRLLPLKTLCLRRIIDGLHAAWVKLYQKHQRETGQMLQWQTANIVGPFDDLPTSLITDLLRTLRSIGVCHPSHFRLLITANTEMLDLSGLNRGATELVAALVRICRHRILKLSLDQCGGLRISFLVNTLSQFRNLQVLNLKRLGIEDAVLETIGSVMSNLRELYLCHNNITDAGLRRLCIDDGHYGQCKQLHMLTLEYNEVTVDGLVLALNSLPRLKVLDSFDLSNAVLQWRQGNPGKMLGLQVLGVNMSELSQANVDLLLDVCPAINTLIFLPTGSQVLYDLTPFLKAPNLTKVMSQCSCVPTTDWFESIGRFITHIDLLGTTNSHLDLTLLDEFCPNLIHLFLHEVVLIETASTKETRRFRNLKSASVQGDNISNFTASLFGIFCAHDINQIKLTLFEIKDELLCQLAQVAQAENILEHLESLELWHCDSVTVKGILALICLAPSLKSIGLFRCPYITRANYLKMKRHCALNRLDIQMICK